MIKSELVQRISGQNPHLYQRDVEKIVNAILGEITAAMARGDRVELRGFGAFSDRNSCNVSPGKTRIFISVTSKRSSMPSLAKLPRRWPEAIGSNCAVSARSQSKSARRAPGATRALALTSPSI